MAEQVATLVDMAKRVSKRGKEPVKPNRTGKAVTIWMDQAIFDRMERFRAAQKFEPTKTEVIELALQEFLDRQESDE